MAYGTNLLEEVMKARPDFEGRVHPIWEMSRRLLQSFTDGHLAEDLKGFQEGYGVIYEFLTGTDFRVDGHMPRIRPDDSMQQLPSGRKRKHGGEFSSPSRAESPANGISLPDVKPVTVSTTTDRGSTAKKSKATDGTEDPAHTVEYKTEEGLEKSGGKGSRSEPYSQHELCSIYIARKIRMLDWDTISWALSRFKTPTVAILSDARAAFDQYHDLIVETIKCCCWPEDSMYLVACAASECLAALDRGSWSEELKNFKSNRGTLYQIYMQRKIERLYRKSFETPKEKRHRRRREKLFGYEGLGIDDYSRLPARKRAGTRHSALEPFKARKRRTKEEMQAFAESKAAARALLKANGLKANGEAISERRKVAAVQAKADSPAMLMPPTFADAEAKQKAAEGNDGNTLDSKTKKAPRRKYDIPEIERIAFAGDIPTDRRLNYDVRPEDKDLVRRRHGSHDKTHGSLNSSFAEDLENVLEEHRARSKIDGGPRLAYDILHRHDPDATHTNSSVDNKYRPWDDQERQPPARDSQPAGSIDKSSYLAKPKSPIQHMSISNILDDNYDHYYRPAPQSSMDHESSKARTMAIGNITSARLPTNMEPPPTTRQVSRSKEKPRTSMSLSALLN